MRPGQHRRHGRRKPYTKLGVLRLPCYRCGGPAHHQWQICSDGNLYRPICLRCDIELNKMVLIWMGDPEWEAKIARYRAQQMKEFKV